MSGFLAGADYAWLVLWPSAVALLAVFLLRRAFLGLLLGAASGALLLTGGDVAEALRLAVTDLFVPIFQSEWKLSAILFTLILGGFVALVEAGGGLLGLLHMVLKRSGTSRVGMQLSIVGFGLLVFFDGLANTMLIGRLMRSAADRFGISRVKLAYLADATGSAVACVAFISTWIAFQLSMIREGYAQVGLDVSPYALFFKSLPANFYCWFALIMVLVCILREFNPGPMGIYEREAGSKPQPDDFDEGSAGVQASHWGIAIVPILVLAISIPLMSYLIGAEKWWPFNLSKFANAYAAAEGHVPQIMVASSMLAAAVAGLTYNLVRHRSRNLATSRHPAFRVFLSGVRDLFGPVCILLAAWMLGGVISQLGAADLISTILSGKLSPAFFPTAVFLTGAAISFTTGTSWGTMAVLMPLAIPVVFSLVGAEADFAATEPLVVASIAAVFSGAVFGDHCSPFSDTTIVASIASGVEPVDHVRTQLPFALLAALVAAVVGFLPLGFGLSPFLSLAAGSAILFLIAGFFGARPGNDGGAAQSIYSRGTES
ncbi:MAG TPA: Na+/H+ antiporter NhaC family protein [Opitutales bacterium]|nr:Na+/H+ antiporter NhaC family protein [Opitutales bacterium]